MALENDSGIKEGLRDLRRRKGKNHTYRYNDLRAGPASTLHTREQLKRAENSRCLSNSSDTKSQTSVGSSTSITTVSEDVLDNEDVDEQRRMFGFTRNRVVVASR